MRPLRIAGLVVGLGLVLGGVAIWAAFNADMRAARAALDGRSQIIETRYGPIEYADVGKGMPLLAIHGAGGGFARGRSKLIMSKL